MLRHLKVFKTILQSHLLSELVSDRCYKHLTKHNMNTEKKVKRHFAEKIPDGAEGCVILSGNVEFLQKPLVMFIRLAKPAQLSGITEVTIETRFVIVCLGKESYKDEFHQIGRVFGNIMADPVVKNVAYTSNQAQHIIEAFDEFSSSSVAMSPNQWDPRIRLQPPVVKDQGMERLFSSEFKGHSQGVGYGTGGLKNSDHELDDSLRRTGRLFGGLMNDIRRKAPWYLSDWTDGFNTSCIATILFLYFAVITPIITFGGLLADATHNNIAAMESMVGAAVAGSIFHMFAGQPLTIIGSTGPILVFETIMYYISSDYGLDYLELRLWVGTFIALMCFVLVATDASYLVMYITRFTEESFSTLISLIFITDGFKKLFSIYKTNKMNFDWQRNNVLSYDCSCYPPLSDVNSTDPKLSRSEEEWNFDAESRIIMHGKDPAPERTWIDENLYHCIYKNDYKIVNLTESSDWTRADVKTCLTYCGVLDGSACPLYKVDEEAFSSSTGSDKDILASLASHSGVQINDASFLEKYQIETLNQIYVPDVFFVSLFLAFGTLALSFTLKGLKQRRYFSVRVRNLISEFAVVISIATMVTVDMLLGMETPKLHVPNQFRPTRSDREWFIPPFGKNPAWSILLAFVFGLMGTILIFMDQQITAVIVNRRENKLKKGVGYHLDLFVASVALLICSWFGLPWFIAATVLSITHVNSLKQDAHQKIPGEPDTFSGCIEQRLTGLCIFVLIG
jgi:anion exchange protein